MSQHNIDILPGKESGAIIREVKKFTAEIMRPAGVELDRINAPADVFREGGGLWDVFKGFRRLDLHLADIPEDLGGIGKMDGLTSVMIAECLGHADVGLAIALMDGLAPFHYASQFKSPGALDLARQFCEDRECRLIGCGSVAHHRGTCECTSGSHVSGPEAFLTASRKNGEFLLNGEVSGVANGPIATHGVFDVHIRSGKAEPETGVAIVPLDFPGISKGAPEDRSGQRSLLRCSIGFRDVTIVGDYVLTDPALIREITGAWLVGENRFLAGAYAGLAMTAFEEALNYSKGRIQGGKPIFNHRNIRLQFFNMFKMIESARAGLRRAILPADRDPASCSWLHAVAARSLAVEAACKVTSEAIQVFGGYGLAGEFPLEKLFRDAWAGMIEHGVTEDQACEAISECASYL